MLYKENAAHQMYHNNYQPRDIKKKLVIQRVPNQTKSIFLALIQIKAIYYLKISRIASRIASKISRISGISRISRISRVSQTSRISSKDLAI